MRVTILLLSAFYIPVGFHYLVAYIRLVQLYNQFDAHIPLVTKLFFIVPVGFVCWGVYLLRSFFKNKIEKHYFLKLIVISLLTTLPFVLYFLVSVWSLYQLTSRL